MLGRHQATWLRHGRLIAVPNVDRLARFADQPNPLPAPPSPTPAEPHVLAAVAASPDGSAVAIAHRAGFRVYTCRPARGEAHLL
jgi:hypothetical protein